MVQVKLLRHLSDIFLQPNAIDRAGLDGVTDADMETLLKVDNSEWLNEAVSIREHYNNYGHKLPKELMKQLDELEARLKA